MPRKCIPQAPPPPRDAPRDAQAQGVPTGKLPGIPPRARQGVSLRLPPRQPRKGELQKAHWEEQLKGERAALKCDGQTSLVVFCDELYGGKPWKDQDSEAGASRRALINT